MILHVDERFKTIKTKKYNEPLFFEIMDSHRIYQEYLGIIRIYTFINLSHLRFLRSQPVRVQKNQLKRLRKHLMFLGISWGSGLGMLGCAIDVDCMFGFYKVPM